MYTIGVVYDVEKRISNACIRNTFTRVPEKRSVMFSAPEFVFAMYMFVPPWLPNGFITFDLQWLNGFFIHQKCHRLYIFSTSLSVLIRVKSFLINFIINQITDKSNASLRINIENDYWYGFRANTRENWSARKPWVQNLDEVSSHYNLSSMLLRACKYSCWWAVAASRL